MYWYDPVTFIQANCYDPVILIQANSVNYEARWNTFSDKNFVTFEKCRHFCPITYTIYGRNHTINFARDCLRWQFPCLRIGVSEACYIYILKVTVIYKEYSESIRIVVTRRHVASTKKIK